MKFDDLDRQMRVFETAHDHEVLPGMFIIARLDGRSFTRLTKESTLGLQRPFDPRFNALMCETVEHLMTATGFSFAYGYTESDEISLLFSPKAPMFNNKLRKINSVLAGEASAFFSAKLMATYRSGPVADRIACFDCRVSQLPRAKQVVDYLRWRMGDSERNCLSSYAYWTLRDKEHMSQRGASEALHGMAARDKHDLLMRHGINYNNLPAWQKRGVGFYTATQEIEGFNPKTQEKTVTTRQRFKVDRELPMGPDYADFINKNFLHAMVEDEIAPFLSLWDDESEENNDAE